MRDLRGSARALAFVTAVAGCACSSDGSRGAVPPDGGGRDVALDATGPDAPFADAGADAGPRIDALHATGLVEALAVTFVGDADVVVGGARDSAGALEPCVERRDAAGARAWVTCFALAGGVVTALATGSDGNVYAVGRDDFSPTVGARGSATFGARGFVASVTPSGNLRWYDEGADSFSGVAAAPDGRVVAVGSRGDDTARRPLVRLLDTGGADVAEFTLDVPTSPLVWASAVAPAAAGTFFVAGNVHQAGFLASVGADGVERFRRDLDGPGLDRALSVTVASDGDALVGGAAASGIDLGTGPLTFSNRKAFVAKYGAADGSHAAHALIDASDAWSLALGAGRIVAGGAMGSEGFAAALAPDLTVLATLVPTREGTNDDGGDVSGTAISPAGAVVVAGTLARLVAPRGFFARLSF